MTTFDYNSISRLRGELKNSEDHLKNAKPNARENTQKRIDDLKNRLARAKEQEGKFLLTHDEIAKFIEYLDRFIEAIETSTIDSIKEYQAATSSNSVFPLYDGPRHLGYIGSDYKQQSFLPCKLSFTYNASFSIKNYSFDRPIKFTNTKEQWDYFKPQALGYLKRLRSVWHKKLS